MDASAVAAHAAARFGLSGRTVLVTGGTKGIGAAIVEEMAGLGARVFTCSRNADDLQSALDTWKARGLQVEGCVADVSNLEQRTLLVEKVAAAFDQQLHVLVNNVGTNIRKPTVEYTSALCQPLLQASGNGCILFNSSVAGGPTAMWSGSIYAMTKAAMNQLSRNLACEWAKHNIRVNSVAPWYTATPLAEQVLQDGALKAEVLSHTPLGRVAKPEDVAGLMAFLASPAGGYVTGQTIAVDGGYSVLGWYRAV